MLFDWNLSKLPFVRQIMNINLYLLLCMGQGSIWNIQICSFALFILRDQHSMACMFCGLQQTNLSMNRVPLPYSYTETNTAWPVYFVG